MKGLIYVNIFASFRYLLKNAAKFPFITFSKKRGGNFLSLKISPINLPNGAVAVQNLDPQNGALRFGGWLWTLFVNE
jgi:hypothetical protein